ncbi:hypothetical protein Tsubulata_017172 [Turnera subulata]|uniref:Peripheral-type benzodiazepine receptor n=1 Tax=Turnera subulata TaxID=218843 RepID=A0A9Q0JQN4_9ROSI|nr:hypothetical protein Tsubulata_017172 [Turnera subulata]
MATTCGFSKLPRTAHSCPPGERSRRTLQKNKSTSLPHHELHVYIHLVHFFPPPPPTCRPLPPHHRSKTRSLPFQIKHSLLLKSLLANTLSPLSLPLLFLSPPNFNPLPKMDPQQNIKQRTRDDTHDTTTPASSSAMNSTSVEAVKAMRSRRDKRMAMAKRGIRSLAVAVAFPLSLTLFNIYFFGSRNGYGTASKPFWFPPLWALHLTCLASSFFMSLSAWLVWAEGGFHKNPSALSFYLGQLGLSLAWDPVVFWMGASWFGLVVCLAMFGTLVGCSRQFREVNPIAGDLVKPCLAWAAFLAIVNLKFAVL